MLNIEKHRNILIKILKNIYTDNSVGPILGFKGGTAALLFYNLNRFSVDLDFDLLDPEKEDFVFEKISKIISKYEILNYFGIPMKVMGKEDMFANKLVALSERIERANRDIYDIWFFLENGWPINRDLVERRTGIEFKDFIEGCIKKIEKVPNRFILAGMGELLNNEQKAWAKAKLKDETLFYLKAMLASK
ncbi:MAG: nucleotidyl transferase AbiEii/AbiGii toxin family protein [Candidatus Pacebacteria bacterium]|nr:nucleotidyl transferase AbiEii/AbiGii toxin family protein [Candidatus Paceibacterota bacterium]